MMRTWRRAALALGIMLAAGPVWAQAPDDKAGPAAVLSQTVRGVTVQLTRVAWDAIEPGDSPFGFYKTFEVSYAVAASPAVPLPPGKKLTDYVTAVTAINPAGFPLDTAGGGPASVRWDDVDPRWSLVAVDVEFLDPSAPARATGRSIGPITIANVPVPTQTDVETPVHVETVTPLGTHVVVEGVKVSPDAQGMKTTFSLHVLPDPQASDLQFGFSTGTKVSDDTGTRLDRRGASSGGPITGAGFLTVSVGGVPGPNAKTMSVTLDATEASELLKQDTWYRHFHLLIPLKTVSTGGRRPYSPLATVQGQDVVATLDSLGWQWNRYRTRIVLRDRTDPDVTWRLRAVRGKDDAGNELLGRSGAGDFLWKTDGAPLAPDENSREVFVGTPGNPSGPWGVKEAPPGAKTLSLVADVEAFREQEHILDFPRIPVPAPGQTLTLNRRVQDAQGAYLVLRKVVSYSPEHPLPAGSDAPDHPFQVGAAPSGLAVVLAEPPALKRRTQFDFRVVAANDPTSRRLLPVRSLPFTPGDALLGAAPPPAGDPARVETFYFRTPAPGARTFNLRMYRDETTRLNKRETVTFPDVPAPAQKPG